MLLTKPVLHIALVELSSRSVAGIDGRVQAKLTRELVLPMSESGSQDV